MPCEFYSGMIMNGGADTPSDRGWQEGECSRRIWDKAGGNKRNLSFQNFKLDIKYNMSSPRLEQPHYSQVFALISCRC